MTQETTTERQSPEDLREQAQHIRDTGEVEEGKNPANVAGGKEAAATRRERHGDNAPGTTAG